MIIQQLQQNTSKVNAHILRSTQECKVGLTFKNQLIQYILITVTYKIILIDTERTSDQTQHLSWEKKKKFIYKNTNLASYWMVKHWKLTLWGKEQKDKDTYLSHL